MTSYLFFWYSNLAAQNLDINEILATTTVTTKATTPEVTSPETIHEKLLGGINNSFDMLHWLLIQIIKWKSF